MSERDYVDITMYHEVDLCFKLGYSVFCAVDEIPGKLVVRDARMVGGDGRNLEVRVLEGWRKPSRVWAIGPSVDRVKGGVVVEQKGLFG